jgi:hypothetical protein
MGYLISKANKAQLERVGLQSDRSCYIRPQVHMARKNKTRPIQHRISIAFRSPRTTPRTGSGISESDKPRPQLPLPVISNPPEHRAINNSMAASCGLRLLAGLDDAELAYLLRHARGLDARSSDATSLSSRSLYGVACKGQFAFWR